MQTPEGFSPRAFFIWLLARRGGGTGLAGRRRAAAAALMLVGLLARLLIAWCGRRIGRRYRRWVGRRRGAVAGLSEGRGSGDRKREEGNAGETLEWGHGNLKWSEIGRSSPALLRLRGRAERHPRGISAHQRASPSSSRLRIAERCVFPSTSRSASVILCSGQSISTTPKFAAA